MCCLDDTRLRKQTHIYIHLHTCAHTHKQAQNKRELCIAAVILLWVSTQKSRMCLPCMWLNEATLSSELLYFELEEND